jgi:hypothetical protein
MESYEDITETGMIRTLYLKGDQEDVSQLINNFRKQGVAERDYRLKGDKDTLYFRQHLWNYIDEGRFQIFVGYSSSFMLPGISYQNMFKELKISHQKRIVIERANYLKPHQLSDNEKMLYRELFIENQESEKDYRHIDTVLDQHKPKCKVSDELEFITIAFECERLRWGLLDYY